MSIIQNYARDRALVMTRGCRADDPEIAALQVAALDDEGAFGVYADWCLEHVRPAWQDNPYYTPEWWRRAAAHDSEAVSLFDEGAEYRLCNACADILRERSGERPVIVDPPEGWDAVPDRDVVVESWRGRVCELSHPVERIMSDVWATVSYAHVLTLDGEIRRVNYANSEFGGGRAEVDAAPEVLDAYRAAKERIQAEREEQARRDREERAREEREREAATPRRGKLVRVVRGRKVPIGTEGRVGWYGESRYGWRVGIDTDDGERVWTSANNVEVVAQAAPEETADEPADVPELRRGMRVVVVRGRKAQGAAGTIGWYGRSRYGGMRVGIDTDDGERVWTDARNVEIAEEETCVA